MGIWRVLGVCGLMWPGLALAFAEDLCWQSNGSGVVACTPLPAECEPVGSSSQACETRAMALVAATAGYAHARSIVHTDAVYFMAQRVGFTADDAYWIAAYDEAVDLGAYEPVDRSGMPIGGGQLATAVIDGFKRSNLADGGVYFHFISPRDDGIGPPAPVDGLHPNLSDAETEGFLVHLRAWALAGSGNARPACTDGLSIYTGSDYALGQSCFERALGQPASIDGVISVFGPTAVNYTSQTGSQVVVSANQPNGPVRAEDFDSVIGGDARRAANARLGIYLHALGDRISHHVCTDRSPLQGPQGVQRGFGVDMSNPDCTQGPHALRHLWEVGVDQDLLDPEHRTLEPNLSKVYDELVAFADARGLLRPGAATDRDASVSALRVLLEQRDGAARLDGLLRLGCSYGYPAFPGTGDCLYWSGFE